MPRGPLTGRVDRKDARRSLAPACLSHEPRDHTLCLERAQNEIAGRIRPHDADSRDRHTEPGHVHCGSTGATGDGDLDLVDVLGCLALRQRIHRTAENIEDVGPNAGAGPADSWLGNSGGHYSSVEYV